MRWSSTFFVYLFDISPPVYLKTLRMTSTSGSRSTWTLSHGGVGPAVYLTWSRPRVTSCCLTCLTRCRMNRSTKTTGSVGRRTERTHCSVCFLERKRSIHALLIHQWLWTHVPIFADFVVELIQEIKCPLSIDEQFLVYCIA